MKRLGLIALAVALWPAIAVASPLVLTYEIRKDGDPIGREVVTINDDGSAKIVTVETHTRATVLFMDFRYDHSRREEWVDGALRHVVGDTDDDGTKTHLDAVAVDGGWRLSVNGVDTVRQEQSLPLTLWGQAILSRHVLFSVIDAKPYKVEVTPQGQQSLTVGGKAVAAGHFTMKGDAERELWYGADGLLLRTTFQRSGFPIEMVRTDG